MKKYCFVIDVAKCENCNNCFLSCKDEHCGNDWQGYSASQPLHGQRWMNISRKERGRFPLIDVAYLPKPCMHCDDAPCIKASKDGAVYKREDGIVIINPSKARGQQAIVAACPYGAIWWNEDSQLPQKCTLCAHLLDQGWKQPRCVQVCPTGALTILSLTDDELNAAIISEKLEILEADRVKTKPRVYYKNLYRFNSCTVAGSVATVINEDTECVEGTPVRLLREGKVVAEQLTDDFGDFKFDGLAEKSGSYMLEIVAGGETVKSVDVELVESLVLDTLWI